MQLNTNKLRTRLFNLGLTQREIAKRAGVNKNTINAVFRGRTCKESTANAIADALGVTLDSIILKK